MPTTPRGRRHPRVQVCSLARHLAAPTAGKRDRPVPESPVRLVRLRPVARPSRESSGGGSTRAPLMYVQYGTLARVSRGELAMLTGDTLLSRTPGERGDPAVLAESWRRARGGTTGRTRTPAPTPTTRLAVSCIQGDARQDARTC